MLHAFNKLGTIWLRRIHGSTHFIYVKLPSLVRAKHIVDRAHITYIGIKPASFIVFRNNYRYAELS